MSSPTDDELWNTVLDGEAQRLRRQLERIIVVIEERLVEFGLGQSVMQLADKPHRISGLAPGNEDVRIWKDGRL